MKINPNSIKIPQNYVLVLPDREFTHFHHGGQESLATGKVDPENVAAHYSICGKVYGVPDDLVFQLAQIKANRVPEAPGMDFEQMMFYFRSQQMETEGYKQGSVLYDVPMQVKCGDTVFFNYQEHYNCYQHGRWMETDLGDMFLIKYDQLICCHPAGDPSAITMLNGLMFVEPVRIETLFGQRVFQRAGLYLVNKKEAIHDIKKKIAIGRVRFHGEHCRGFINEPDKEEGPYDFKPGQLVVYNPKVAPALEFSLHKTAFAGVDLVKLRRRDIFAILPMEITDGLVEDLVTSLNLN